MSVLTCDEEAGPTAGQALDQGFEHLAEVLLGAGADLPGQGLAVLEKYEGRHATHLVASRDGLVLVDVDLQHVHPPVELAGELHDDWRDGLAGAAPFRGELHQRAAAADNHGAPKAMSGKSS